MQGSISLGDLQEKTSSVMLMRTCGIIVRNEWSKSKVPSIYLFVFVNFLLFDIFNSISISEFVSYISY